MWVKEDALFVYASNAIEGNTLTLGETTVVLEDGVTIGGKTVKEHLEVVNGAKAYALMLDMARDNRPITVNTLLAVHETIVAGEEFAGMFHDGAVYIRGSQHVLPNAVNVRQLIAEMFETYVRDVAEEHPVVAGATLHFAIAHIHPFVDGNGRTARILNNLHLISHGYPPVLIDPVDDKPTYFDALRAASLAGTPGKGDPARFVDYMVRMEQRSLDRYFRALETAHGPDESTTRRSRAPMSTLSSAGGSADRSRRQRRRDRGLAHYAALRRPLCLTTRDCAGVLNGGGAAPGNVWDTAATPGSSTSRLRCFCR